MATKIRRFNTTSVNSVDGAKSILLRLESTCKTSNITTASENIDLYEQYIRELAECNEYRFIFTIRPYCTNVLFNPFTEVVDWDEDENDGTLTCTRYIVSKPVEENDKSEYFPGFDIMDNHLLRSKVFTYVGPKDRQEFNSISAIQISNTIRDIQTNSYGEPIKQKFRRRWDTVSDEVDIHLYKTDDVFRFYNEEMRTFDSFEMNVSEDDGWYGFSNTSTINDRCFDSGALTTRDFRNAINSEKPCSFVDLYPGRKQFTFVPQYNKHNDRDEYNWDVMITYPYSNATHPVTGIDGFCGLAVIQIKRSTSNGETVVYFRSHVRHNLTKGDRFRLYKANYTDRTLTYSEIDDTTEHTVLKIGDESGQYGDYFFAVTGNSFTESWGPEYDSRGFFTYRFCRVADGYNSMYYARKLKPIPLRKEIYPLAFAKNIYGDDVVQITFTDGADVSNLKDNRGRPLSELYLTIIKTNDGHSEWYDGWTVGDGVKTFEAPSAAYHNSRCFGNVTGGVETLNIADRDGKEVDTNKNPKTRLDDIRRITDDKDGNSGVLTGEDGVGILPTADDFFCDIVEYSPSTDTETVLADIYHRFNTVQREECEGLNLKYNEIISDDYDQDGFKVSKETKDLKAKKEGYYYKHSYRIPIKQLSEPKTASHRDIDTIEVKPTADGTLKLNVRSLSRHKLGEGDRVRIYDDGADNVKYIEFVVTDVMNRARFNIWPVEGKWVWANSDGESVGDNFIPNVCIAMSSDIDGLTNRVIVDINNLDEEEATDEYKAKLIDLVRSRRLNDSSWPQSITETDEFIILKNAVNYRLCAVNIDIPDYAFGVGKNRYIWRDVYNNGDIRATEIPERTFANGAVYITENIGFFLRRQDPDFTTLNDDDEGDIPDIPGNIRKDSIYDYEENIQQTC